MKIKIFSLLLVLVMAISMLASCNIGGVTPGGDGGGGDGGGEEVQVPWTKTDLKISLTRNSNSDELSSGCYRYYAGGDPSAFAALDTKIRDRNNAAQRAANVKVSYTYIEDSDSSKGWGGNINDMVTETMGGSTSATDVYCNFAYDMTCAAIRGCFSNLLDKSQPNGNYFRFTEADYKQALENVSEEDYFNSEIGEGYFYKYMESLSLTPATQIYCLASDYTLDVMRAFIVIPVNVELMNSISITDSAAGDKNQDGSHDIQDFYEMVWDKGWDYTALAKYSNAISQNSNDDPNTDIGDERVGFALGTGSGLSPTGMLYTTSVKILNKNADGSFSYPATNPALDEFNTAIKNLFFANKSLGVCVVDKTAAQSVVTDAKTELIGIRTRFAQNHVLFGGTIMVGSLEEEVYQGMRTNGSGFGIVPVPLYRSNAESGDEYKTIVHNVARIVSISKATKNFAQCTAFLDYQSKNSDAILEEYYTVNLAAAVGGGENEKMLNYIRNHVNDCFDKTYEDVIANYMEEKDPNASGTRWHGMLMKQNYQVGSFSSVYEGVLATKQGHINTVYNDWCKLDD